MFPGGETPEGLTDMSGNVWEWTRTLYKPYAQDAADGAEDPDSGDGRRVVRGSWDDGQSSARRVPRPLHPRLPESQSGFSVVLFGPHHKPQIVGGVERSDTHRSQW
jgi:formylglycine-generating enzyme required for sulfatase activity